MNIFQVITCVLNLAKVLPLQDDFSLKAATILLDADLYDECILEIKNRMHVSCKLNVAHNNQYFDKYNALARVEFDTGIPYYGTKELKDYTVKMIVSLRLRDLPNSTYIQCIAHEMAHIILFSIKSQYADSELATDMTTMILGFSQSLRENRFYCGYLDGYNFWVVYTLIKTLQFKKNILMKFTKWMNLFPFYKKVRS